MTISNCVQGGPASILVGVSRSSNYCTSRLIEGYRQFNIGKKAMKRDCNTKV